MPQSSRGLVNIQVKWLAAQGHEVRVVTAPPYYPDWEVSDGYSKAWYSKNHLRDVAVWRCPLYVPKKPSGLKRIIHLASFALTSSPVMIKQLFWKPDVVWVAEPPLFCAPTAWAVARFSGGKCWLHVQDFEVDAAFDLGRIKGSASLILNFIVKYIEDYIYMSYHGANSKLEVIGNGCREYQCKN